MFEQLSILIKVRCPKLFKVLSHQCHLQVDNHFPSAAGCAISNAGQDALGLLGRLGTLETAFNSGRCDLKAQTS